MTFSLNEVEAIGKKAARGAGYPWGLAEEAGKAVRWLCAAHVDGVKILADLLALERGNTPHLHRPDHMTQDTWQGAGPICPLTTGASLSDYAARLPQGPITIHNVVHPAMILPFAAFAARQMNGCVTVQIDQVIAQTDGSNLSLPGPVPDHADTICVRFSTDDMTPISPASRADPDPASWLALTLLAQRTYAPATDESRRLGAGSGLSDND